MIHFGLGLHAAGLPFNQLITVGKAGDDHGSTHDSN